jgi:two-component system CheB/CheR fusion protein
MATARKHTSPPRARAEDPRVEFLDVAGHELRSPIAALKGHVQLLQRRMRKQEDRAADLAELDKMTYQIERLSHQLDIYLDATHIWNGKMMLAPAEVDLVAVARRLVTVYAGGSSGHTVRLEAQVEELRGVWDRKRIEEALSALLSNAIKYSAEGEVRVVVARRNNAAVVEVSDSGIGVPPAERHAIFEAYTRGSNAENAGSGLGLYVARDAIRRHHGRMGMRTRRGGGSIFWFTLPLPGTPGLAS